MIEIDERLRKRAVQQRVYGMAFSRTFAEAAGLQASLSEIGDADGLALATQDKDILDRICRAAQKPAAGEPGILGLFDPRRQPKGRHPA